MDYLKKIFSSRDIRFTYFSSITTIDIVMQLAVCKKQTALSIKPLRHNNILAICFINCRPFKYLKCTAPFKRASNLSERKNQNFKNGSFKYINRF